MRLRSKTPSGRRAALRIEQLESRCLLAGDLGFRLELTNLAGSPVTQAPTGTDFLLSAYIQDRRAEPEGVFAAFLDVAYQQSDDNVFSPVFSEVQRITFPHDTLGGGYQLRFDGETSATIGIGSSFEQLTSNLKAGLEALPNIPAGSLRIKNSPFIDGVNPQNSNSFIFDVFFAGTLAETDVPLMEVAESRLITQSGVRTIAITEFAKGVRQDAEAFRLAFRSGPNYLNGLTAEDGDRHPATGELLDADVFSEAGAFAGGAFSAGSEGDERLLWSVQLNADNLGTASFSANPADSPDSIVLVLSSQDAFPTSNIDYGQSVSIEVIEATYDFGDAPAPFPTLLSDDGARHIVLQGAPILGLQAPDSDDDGNPHPMALGDDQSQANDEDGVSGLTGIHIATTRQEIDVITAGPDAFLSAWVDFNQDGDWLDAGEQIFVNTPLPAGSRQLPFTVPDTAIAGVANARFRISSQTGLTPMGTADDGEVEDHQMTLVEWTNPRDSKDVNDDGAVSPVDALIIINRLNRTTSSQLPALPASPPPYLDANNDGFITPADSLVVINYLNRVLVGEGETTINSRLEADDWRRGWWADPSLENDSEDKDNGDRRDQFWTWYGQQ